MYNRIILCEELRVKPSSQSSTFRPIFQSLTDLQITAKLLFFVFSFFFSCVSGQIYGHTFRLSRIISCVALRVFELNTRPKLVIT